MKIIKANKFSHKFVTNSWDNVLPQVKTIIQSVRKNGDTALRKLTRQFDRINLSKFEVTPAERKSAYRQVPKEIITSLEKASGRIRSFAKKQLSQINSFEYKTKECLIGQRIIPLEKVGVYVPGGKYPLPSSALMGIIPAKVAGVKEIIVCSPRIQPITIVAADMSGADRIFKIGGAQAIAAMAYGTRSIPKADKIVGAGNRYVAAAKYLVSKDCGIDMLAGPSEIIVIADKSANPAWIAADLIAQAEHDIYAGCYCITDSNKMAYSIMKELDTQIKNQPNQPVIRESLKKGAIILADNIEQCVKITDEMAPEHLLLHIKNPYGIMERFTNYGALFLGGLSAVAFGDYVTGSNHILPTGRTARFASGLSVLNFLKCASYQSVTPMGVKALTKIASPLIRAEGLYGHLTSITIRNGK